MTAVERQWADRRPALRTGLDRQLLYCRYDHRPLSGVLGVQHTAGGTEDGGVQICCAAFVEAPQRFCRSSLCESPDGHCGERRAGGGAGRAGGAAAVYGTPSDSTV